MDNDIIQKAFSDPSSDILGSEEALESAHTSRHGDLLTEFRTVPSLQTLTKTKVSLTRRAAAAVIRKSKVTVLRSKRYRLYVMQFFFVNSVIPSKR